MHNVHTCYWPSHIVLILKIWFSTRQCLWIIFILDLHIILTLKPLKVDESRSNLLIWDLVFLTANLYQNPGVQCDPRWLPFLLTMIRQPPRAREGEKGGERKEYLIKLCKLINLKSCLIQLITIWVFRRQYCFDVVSNFRISFRSEIEFPRNLVWIVLFALLADNAL